ncbi:hypothetical protein FACS189449_11650 [Alphaproteobacteria bacterium]|nr:hypothetical protein FACS189449_11650 [Alphaproteobacteria bacterium]
MHDLDQYEDAELVRKKTAAMFAGFVTRLDPEDNVFGDQRDVGSDFCGLEPGTMQFLEPGEDVKFSSPADVGGTYEVFIKQQLRAISVGLGITYEQLTGDLSDQRDVGSYYLLVRQNIIARAARTADSNLAQKLFLNLAMISKKYTQKLQPITNAQKR